MQDQLTLPHGQQLLIHCWDEKVLPISPRLQDERDVHSQDVLTAKLTSRSGWVRIIHRVRQEKTAGPGLSFHHSSHLARAESTTRGGHSPYRQPQSQTVYCYLKLTPSMGALTVLDDCRVTVKVFLRTSVCEKPSPLVVFSWPYVEPESDSERPDHAGACGVSGGTMHVKAARKVKQDVWEV